MSSVTILYVEDEESDVMLLQHVLAKTGIHNPLQTVKDGKEAKDYLVENLKVEVLSIEGRPVQVDLPSSIVMKVVESADGVKGDSANNVQKPAVLETGLHIQVPLFIKEGERIKVDSRTGAYMGRA